MIGSGRSQTVIVNNHYSGGSMWAPYYTPGGGYFHSYYWPMTWTRHTVGGGVNPLGAIGALVFLIALLAIVGAGAWYGTRRIRR
ncbi:hypothetical protein C7H75_24525 (plasmid) [Prescottella equi]|nr:hypothetical protein C7H75_24525 [Prescottella equi]